MASTAPSLTAIKGWIFSQFSGVWGGLDGIEERGLQLLRTRVAKTSQMRELLREEVCNVGLPMRLLWRSEVQVI
jgi:hypothetical protein